jgi:hypothetical protein
MMMMRNRGITLKFKAMPTRKKNDPDALDANPSIDNAGLSIAPSMSGSNIADATPSTLAGADVNTTPPLSKNVNTQMVTHLYSRASRWISENPTLAIGAAVGIVAAVIGVAIANQASRRRSDNADAYSNGETYENSYRSESVPYNPSRQAGNIKRRDNYTSSGSDSDTGYDSATEGNTGW